MPSLNEIKQKRHSKFVKKTYRVWDLTGEKNVVNSYPDATHIKDISLSPSSQQSTTSLLQKSIDNNQITTKQQSDNNKTTDRQQTANNQVTIEQQIDDAKDNKQTTIEHLQQIDRNLCTEEEIVSIIKNLTGLQEKFFFLVLEYCNFNNDLQTGQLKTTQIGLFIGCGYRSTKTIIERVVKKNIVKRLKGKCSVTGFIQFEIPKEIKIIGNRLELYKKNSSRDFNKFIFEIRQQIRQQTNNEIDNANYSSSYIYNKTTTEHENNKTLDQSMSHLELEWQNIDIEPLVNIGFTKSHLFQVAKQKKLEPQVVQDSIYAFAFDLQTNNKIEKIKGDPINFFMGILRKVGPYVTPSNYESPQDKAMRIYLETKRETEQRRADIEKEAINLAFNEWFSKLTDNEKIEMLPEMLRRNTNSEKLGKSKMLESSARSHFEKEIWPNIKKGISSDIVK